MKKISILLFTVLVFFVNAFTQEARQKLDLSGEWQFNVDNSKVGVVGKWYNKTLSDKVTLPGSMDENQKGNKVNWVTEMNLNRVYDYAGAAWYRKSFVIPADWNGKYIELFLERTKVTKVWIDSVYIGASNNIFVPQKYNLTGLAIGTHTVTVMVDNSWGGVPVSGHAYSNDTQTNWNGIIGKIEIGAYSPVHIEKLAVIPDITNKKATLKLTINSPDSALHDVTFSAKAYSWNTSAADTIDTQAFIINIDSGRHDISINYQIGDKMQLWSEFNPVLYKIEVKISAGAVLIDSLTTSFGMREFKTNGKQFTINGKTIFLRGKHDACVFPLTGHPPMDTAGWIRVFKIAKTYGVNHYRFHSWTPPQAAFDAADICGIYMQPELPNWQDIRVNNPDHVTFNLKEGRLIIDNYRNNPSFVMMSMGNEIYEPVVGMKAFVDSFRSYNSKLLYAQGSNNRAWYSEYAVGDDYWTTFRVGKEQNDCSTDVRSSISFVDSYAGGVLNTVKPSTSFTYSKAIAKSPVPVIGHEIGEYQIYPNYDEVKKYTGVLKASNFGVFKSALTQKGMANQAKDFFKASGALAVMCYKAEIENAIRTPNFGGFHLLDLQDYPGQGTALVGILDAFMDSKGLISPDSFRQWCNSTVVLLNMSRYCWGSDETFTANIQVANYSGNDYAGKFISWSISDSKTAKVLFDGQTSAMDIVNGNVKSLGVLSQSLSKIQTAAKLTVTLELAGSDIKNTYNIWVYPSGDVPVKPADITVVPLLHDSIFKKLENGEKVLLYAGKGHTNINSVPGQYITEFWNYKMFLGFAAADRKVALPGTMGILTNPEHPIFNYFPTDFHTNWQWWNIVKRSRPTILDNTDSTYKPIVQVIDNINRNHKLALIYEYKVGKGKLLICNFNISAIQDSVRMPEAKQMYYSIYKYMESDKFNPETEIAVDSLRAFFNVKHAVVNVDQVYENQGVIFPNPAAAELTVKYNSNYKTVYICNTAGVKMLSKKVANTDLISFGLIPRCLPRI